MSKFIGQRQIGFVLALILMFVATPLMAGGMETGQPRQAPDNIGFMKNPPKELQDKFTMCDAFLKVEWIDKEKKIGTSRFDLYKDGKKVGQMRSLIYLSNLEHRDRIELYDYERKGELEELYEAIKNGNIVDKAFPYIKYESRTYLLQNNNVRPYYSYSDNRQNVCIVYPDNKYVFIAEGKRVGTLFNSVELKEKFQNVKSYIRTMPFDRFSDYNVIDVNLDGVEDYVGGRGFVYSFLGKYYVRKREIAYYEKGEAVYKISFPPINFNCIKSSKSGHFLTSDGSNYFFSNKCNLTELTQAGE